MDCDIQGCSRCTRRIFVQALLWPFCFLLTAISGCVVAGAEKLGHQAPSAPFFDTVTLDVGDAGKVAAAAVDAGYNLRQLAYHRSVEVRASCNEFSFLLGSMLMRESKMAPPRAFGPCTAADL